MKVVRSILCILSAVALSACMTAFMQHAVAGGDFDNDGILDLDDNCLEIFNPDQSDGDSDAEGDACDLDDGVILITMSDPDFVDWQEESGFTAWNMYRGDLAVLQSTGQYTQEPCHVQCPNPITWRECGKTQPFGQDTDNPSPYQVFYYLVTGTTEYGTEGSLGVDSNGTVRPNHYPCIPANGWVAEFWNTPGAESSPPMPTRDPDAIMGVPTVDFNWGQGQPHPDIDSDHFVSRFRATKYFRGDVHFFEMVADDGIRLYVDGSLLIDQWNDQGEAVFVASMALSEGMHDIMVEHYENGGGAVVKLAWAPATSPGWFNAVFWNNPNMVGLSVLSRTDPFVDFDWGIGSPGPGVNADQFSARWSGLFDFVPGNYLFTITADDGFRLVIDGDLILNEWNDQTGTRQTSQYLEGEKVVFIQYYDNIESAMVRMRWQQQ